MFATRMTCLFPSAVAIAASALLMSACQRPAPRADAADTVTMRDAKATSSKDSLIGPTWTLVELDGQPAPLGAGDRPATLIVEGAGQPRASGFAGCNRWSSAYSHTPPDRITFTAPLSTKMACATGMDLERRFLGLITAVREYSLSDSGLVLKGEGGAVGRFVAR
jgi:heat shock protein HslJ